MAKLILYDGIHNKIIHYGYHFVRRLFKIDLYNGYIGIISMTKFVGEWKSERYDNISGRIEIYLPCEYTDKFETTVELHYNSDTTFRKSQIKTFEVQGKFSRDSSGKNRYILIPRALEMQQSFMYTFVENSDSNEWNGFYTCIYPYDIGRANISISCQGCLEDQPGQYAHMEPGGCLEL